MNIILGFGSIEQQEREKIKKVVKEALLAGKDICEALEPWNKKAKEYDEMPRDAVPERYTKVWFYDDKLHFHHINRRHPFSPDGWALLQVEEGLD